MTKFADHADLFCILKSRVGCRELQKDYTALRDWMINWKMEFNAEKHEVMCIWKNKCNFMMDSVMMGSKMTYHSGMRSLIIIDNFTKLSLQCSVKGKNQMLGINKRRIENKTENVIMLLYKSPVHLHLNVVYV